MIDHYSRRAMGFAIFRNNPTSVSIQSFLESTIVNASAAPNYIICDQGQQFWCDAFRAWCGDQGITPRFGAVGQHGSIALVERFILTLKNECTRIILVPLRREALHRELRFFIGWFNQHRPHSALDGKTPYEMYHEITPACERSRYEPRGRWPHRAPYAFPHAQVNGYCGARIRLDVRYYWGRKHLRRKNADRHRHRLVNCHSSVGANFRWTRTPPRTMPSTTGI